MYRDACPDPMTPFTLDQESTTTAVQRRTPAPAVVARLRGTLGRLVPDRPGPRRFP